MIISEVNVTYCEVLRTCKKLSCTGCGRSFTLAGLHIDSSGRKCQKTVKCLNLMFYNLI